MTNNSYKWEVLNKTKNQKSLIHSKSSKEQAIRKNEDIINILLENRGIKTGKEKQEFFSPKHPEDLTLKSLGIDRKQVDKALKRIKKAVKNNEEIVIYGDYDADGICATAVLWETLYSLTKKARPYIPSRFDEGYGLNGESVRKLKVKNEKLKVIITVDNGIVAQSAIETANGLGIDVIVTDHHQKEKKLPKAYSIIHTDKVSGSGIAWVFARELKIHFKIQESKLINDGMELAAIGTIADQMPLIGANRSFAKYGLVALNRTERAGLLALFAQSGLSGFKGGSLQTTLQDKKIGTNEVNFVIAPRINAMGRLEHAIDSLRLLCTRNNQKARELAEFLGRTNKYRQSIVEEVVLHARNVAQKSSWKGTILLAHETYHEGVIGLAASKLVEEFRRPAIVLSKGEKISKASARSVTGFNIIEFIRKLDGLILGGGGHPMAAGFSIETDKIELFKRKFDEISIPFLTDEVLTKKLKIDVEVGFDSLNQDLAREFLKFEPMGLGNPEPVFSTNKVRVIEARTVGTGGKHLKLMLENKEKVFSAIAFSMGNIRPLISSDQEADVAYNLEFNTWNGNTDLQLKVKDVKIRKNK